MVVLPQSEPHPDERKYRRREEREYGGVKYYCYFYGDDWLTRKIQEVRENPVKDFLADWTNPDPLSFGIHHHVPEFPSFLDIAKNGVRMKDRPIARPSPEAVAAITDAHTGVTQSLNDALKEVRHKGESFPSPFLTHVYTVNPDE
jgi:hypothetical protein